MRKIIALMSVFAIVIAMSFPARAANESYVSAFPGLSFSGTTATCSLDVYASHATDPIVASVTLKHGSSTVKQWTNSDFKKREEQVYEKNSIGFMLGFGNLCM